jgi:lipopolysaccharide/colanic/teichoic acid biosynthesis glycosyltransferase
MHYSSRKRILDVLVGAILLVALLPVWAAVAVVLLLAQGRPVFYRQARVGQDGRSFTLLKFRTMAHGTPPPPGDTPVVKDHADPRITPLGRLLRRTALDELPQLWNVLRGEMSLVGPRPLPVADLEHPGWLEEIDPAERARREGWLRRRHSIPPGLTGLWQISPNPAEDFENWLARDLAYLDRRSLLLDLYILLATPFALLRGRKRSA